MNLELFMAVYKQEENLEVKNELLKRYLKNNYKDEKIKKVLDKIYSWTPTFSNDTKIKMSDLVFEDLSKKMKIILETKMEEKDKEFITKVLEKYLEKGLEKLQQTDKIEEQKYFLYLFENIEKEYTSPKLKELFEKSKERLGKPLELTYEEEEIPEYEKLKLGSLSKLKKADIDYILDNTKKYDKESIKKLINHLIKKEKIDEAVKKGMNLLLILETRVEEYMNGKTDSINLSWEERKKLEEIPKEEKEKVLSILENKDDKKQIQVWLNKNDSYGEKQEKIAIMESKQFNVLIKIMNKKLENVNSLKELMYDPTLDQMGREKGKLEEKKETKFYTYIEDKEFLVLEYEKKLIERDEKTVIIRKEENEGLIRGTGKTLEELDKWFDKKIKTEGLIDLIQEDLEKYVDKIKKLENEFEDPRNSIRKQWQKFGKLAEKMAVVLDYMNKKAERFNDEEDKGRGVISEVVALISKNKEEMINLFNEFVEIYNIKIKSEKDYKKYVVRASAETQLWFTEVYASTIIESIKELYDSEKSEEDFKRIISSYLNKY